MNNLRNGMEIEKVLEGKVKKLEKIALNWEKNPEKATRAESFLTEIEDIKDFLQEEAVVLLQKNSFEKKLREADEFAMEYDGEFCKVAVIYEYPKNGQWIIYTAAVSSL